VVLLAVMSAPVAGSDRVKPADSAIRYLPDVTAARESAARENKPLVILFAAAWCSACQQLEEQVLLETPVQDLATDFIWVRVDIDRHLSVARDWEVDATPTLIVLEPGGAVDRKIVGMVRPDRLAELLRTAASRSASSGGETTVLAEVNRHSALSLGPGGYRAHSICFSHVGYGPLSIRSQSPFQGLRLAVMPRAPSTLARGQHQVRLAATWANVWAVDQGLFDPANGQLGPYVFDSETLDLDVSYSYGLSDIFELGLGYEQRWRFGGVMDGFIEGFHDLFSIDQSGRDRWPRDQTFIFIDPGDGQPPVIRDGSQGRTIARSAIATFQHNVTCGKVKLPAFSWSATVRTSFGGEVLEGSDVDLAVSAAASRRFGDFYLYLTLGYTWYGTDEVDGLELSQSQLSVLAAAEWRFKPRMSLVLQYLGSEGVAVDLGPFSETSHEVVAGWKWELHPAGVLEIGLLQNIITFDNSPDFGVHAAFTQRF
jgi:thioredoxin-related protein